MRLVNWRIGQEESNSSLLSFRSVFGCGSAGAGHAPRRRRRSGCPPCRWRSRVLRVPGGLKRREQRIRADNTFEILAREWYASQRAKWTVDYAATALRRIETHLFPPLGSRPIAEIDAPELLDALRLVERHAEVNSRGSNEIAHRMLQTSGQIFRYAIATARARRNP